jgi:hypothetical protein
MNNWLLLFAIIFGYVALDHDEPYDKMLAWFVAVLSFMWAVVSVLIYCMYQLSLLAQ